MSRERTEKGKGREKEGKGREGVDKKAETGDEFWVGSRPNMSEQERRALRGKVLKVGSEQKEQGKGKGMGGWEEGAVWPGDHPGVGRNYYGALRGTQTEPDERRTQRKGWCGGGGTLTHSH